MFLQCYLLRLQDLFLNLTIVIHIQYYFIDKQKAINFVFQMNSISSILSIINSNIFELYLWKPVLKHLRIENVKFV